MLCVCEKLDCVNKNECSFKALYTFYICVRVSLKSVALCQWSNSGMGSITTDTMEIFVN